MEKQSHITAVISDDHAIVRQGVRNWLEEENIAIVGEAETFEQTIKILDQHQPDVLLQDLQLHDKSGVELIAQLRQRYPKLKIIAITGMHKSTVREILDAGANGFLAKEENREAFIQAVQWAASKVEGVWIGPSAAQGYFESDRKLREHEFSWRELQILRLLEYPNKQIAAELRITEGTVKNYVSGIFLKIGVTTRLAAIKFAREQGVIPG